MITTTPFHPRLSELNKTGLYGHWSGHLSTLRYSDAPKHEYFAVRNSVGVFDTSPLYKYWIRGRDAEALLAGVFTRDIRTCRPGRAQYTIWCDDRGFVMEDGVVFRHSDNEFFMTAARPNLGYLSDLIGRLQVEIEDVSDDYGILAIQGPRSRELLSDLTGDIAGLRYFQHTETKVAGLAGHGEPHRLHRRPRLRGHRPARPGARRPGRDPRGRGGATACARSARTR